ncbi:MAG: preprotein translocase subunit YajC [Actinomycetota bacterium]|jgi:preprotein translocase subunit YajC|nr:preprotein translocase subunit YajC [Actinomycetota bacterium]
MAALLPLIITFGLMWALLIRPQQRRVRQHQELVATVSAGDEVITTGGIVGTILFVVDDIVTLEVAPGLSIRLLRSAIQSRIAPYTDDLADSGGADEVFDHDDDDDDDDDMAEFEDDVLDSEPEPAPPAPPPPPTAPIPTAATPTAATPTGVDAEYIPPPSTPPPIPEEKA